MKSLVLFFATFVLGAALALGTRTALHEPHAGSAEHQLGPVASPPSLSATNTAATPVNTVCALCGMDVDPSLPPATYQGRLVGFGCAACPPKFARDPDRYGPHALRNEIAPK